jgi:hypothetical protein
MPATVTKLLLVLIGAAIGAALSIVFRGTGPGTPAVALTSSGPRPGASSVRPTAGPSADDEAARGASGESLAAPVEAERVVLPATRSSIAPAHVIDEAVQAVRAAPAASRVRGDRAIRGRVVRTDGSPLAGALIRARRLDGPPREPGPSRIGKAPPPADSLERSVQRAVESWYERAAQSVETTSAADGGFVLDSLQSGRWWLEPWCEGFVIEVPGGGSFEVEPDATLDLAAIAVQRIVVDVELPDGTAAPRAALSVASGAGSQRSQLTFLWTPESRELWLKPGRHEVRATLGDPDSGPEWPEPLSSEPRSLEIFEGVAAAPARFVLRGTPGVRGRVLWQVGARRTTPVVKIAPAPPAAAPDLVALAQDPAAANVFAHQGSFTFRDLAPGRWVVGVARNWGEAIVAHAVVEVRDQMVVQDLVMPPADPATGLTVKVTDVDGAMVDDCEFTLRMARDGRASWARRAAAERKPDGRWWVALGLVDDVDLAQPWPEGVTLDLTVSSTRLGSKNAAVAPTTRSLEVRFGAPARLLASVAGFSGSGYESRLQLALERVADDGASNRAPPATSSRHGLAPDGTQPFGPVEAGAWRLSLHLQGRHPWQRRRVATLELLLAPGDNSATIALPRLSDLVVEASGRSGTMQLQSVATEETEHADIDAEGRATFVGLPPGDYTLQTLGSVFEMMQLRLPIAVVVRFEPMVVNAALVTIKDPDGVLFTQGFRDGDLIVALDGQEFESSMQLQIVLMQGIARGPEAVIEFTVERGGGRVSLAVDASQLLQGQRHGGTIRPTRR